MIRNEKTGSGGGFRNVSVGGRQSSKLEEKKKRVLEGEKSPVVRKVGEFDSADKRKIEDTRKMLKDEDEVPTGFLDEEDVSVDQEEVPTGFLDEDEVGVPEIKVRKVDPSEVENYKVRNVKSDVSSMKFTSENEGTRLHSGKSEVRNGKGRNQKSEGAMRNPARVHGSDIGSSTGGKDINQKKERSKVEKGNYESFVADDPPVRKEDLESEIKDRDKKSYDPKKKKGRGGVIAGVLIGIILIGVVIVGAAYLRSRLEGDNSVGGSGMSLEKLTSYVDSLYTDATKVNIRDGVGYDDVQDCIGYLSKYKESSDFNEDDYDRVSQEIGTISFFLQDLELYDELVTGTYEKGSKGYTESVNTIKSDIYMYTVVGLADTMTTKLQILDTTSSVVEVQTETESDTERSSIMADITGIPSKSTEPGSIGEVEDGKVGVDIESEKDSVIVDNSTERSTYPNETEVTDTENAGNGGVSVSDVLNSLG